MAEVGAACVCDRIPAAEGCSAAVLHASPTWLRSPHTGSCCPGSIAANNIQGSKLNQSDHKRTAAYLPPTGTHLVGFGTVFERARIVDVIHQTHHVTGEVGLQQEVKIWHHLMELVCRERRRGARSRDHHAGAKTDILLCSSCWSSPAGTSPDRKRKLC